MILQEKNIAEVRENEMILDQFLNEEIESIISIIKNYFVEWAFGSF